MRAHLLNDAFFDGLTTSMEGFETAETLPPACYVDAGFYEFEKEAVFGHCLLYTSPSPRDRG